MFYAGKGSIYLHKSNDNLSFSNFSKVLNVEGERDGNFRQDFLKEVYAYPYVRIF